MAAVVAIDAGTTGIRCVAYDTDGSGYLTHSYRELTQHFPRPGWVEHDPMEIWDLVRATLTDVAANLASARQAITCIGITNQRETVVAWDRARGLPLARAIVWQDRRTAPYCDRLREAGHLDAVRSTTGLMLDPYFSASKMGWLLDEGGIEASPRLALGTVDSWICWNLTGGPDLGVHVTDPSNASRTMLFDIARRRWSEEMCGLFGIPRSALADVAPSSGRFGVTAAGMAGDLPSGIPVSGIAGDQAAALFGQACFAAGATKATYGTGSFVLMNAGAACPEPAEGVLTSVAWELGSSGALGADRVAYALEGAVFATGAAIQWLRDGLGIIADPSEVGPLAASIGSTEGVYFVPAFTGLGCPWWDPYARGILFGITRGSGRAHIARAVVESIAYQVRDAVDAMSTVVGGLSAPLRADGGAAVMDLLLQIQADQLQSVVQRSAAGESTALGAAWLAGLAEGVWTSLDELTTMWRSDLEIEPAVSMSAANQGHRGWLRAVERARAWAPSEPAL